MREESRKAEEVFAEWNINDIQSKEDIWKKNGGEIITMSPDEVQTLRQYGVSGRGVDPLGQSEGQGRLRGVARSGETIPLNPQPRPMNERM